GLLLPTSQMRALRELEPPALDEGLSSVERIEFQRVADPARSRPGVFVAAAAAAGWRTDDQHDAPHLLFNWSPDAQSDTLNPRGARRAGGGGARGPAPRRALPAGGGPAVRLGPTAAPGPAARVRAYARHRRVALGAGRHRPRPPDARGDARRALRERLASRFF